MTAQSPVVGENNAAKSSTADVDAAAPPVPVDVHDTAQSHAGSVDVSKSNRTPNTLLAEEADDGHDV